MNITNQKTEPHTNMKVIECPRDAMQGIDEFIPTQVKTDYINALLKVGFDTIDFGSFVSPHAMPQMRDTAKVLEGLDMDNTKSKLLAIVANERGAQDAVAFDEIYYLGFPLSLSETFQMRNTRKTIDGAITELNKIQNLCIAKGKKLVVYLSMGFGNPYNEPYSYKKVISFIEQLKAMGISIISLSDTVGMATPYIITTLLETVLPAFPTTEIGVHLHTTPDSAYQKIDAVYKAGGRRIDVAIGGLGGCPMADDELVGNLATETLINYLSRNVGLENIDLDEFKKASNLCFTSILAG